MRYVLLILILGLSACAKDRAMEDSAPAPPFAVAEMTCATTAHATLCSTAIGATQVKPAECADFLGSGGMGVPIESAGRTTGVYYTVSGIYDCGVRSGQRCIFIEYANGWQDMRCDDYQLP